MQSKKVCCAGEGSQGPLLERQRELEQKLRDNVGEMLRQRNHAIKLHERVESLIEGDIYHIAGPERNGDAMACSWALVPCVASMGVVQASWCQHLGTWSKQQR